MAKSLDELLQEIKEKVEWLVEANALEKELENGKVRESRFSSDN